MEPDNGDEQINQAIRRGPIYRAHSRFIGHSVDIMMSA